MVIVNALEIFEAVHWEVITIFAMLSRLFFASITAYTRQRNEIGTFR